MTQIEEIQKLTVQLNQHRHEYYNLNQPTISDLEYDNLCDKLFLLEEKANFRLSNSPSLTVGYEVMSKLEKTTHKTPLLSLDKTKSVDELNQWRKDKDTILMLKADGLTIELEYNNQQLVSASTRGNGEIGELITTNAFTFQNLPKTIPFNGKLRLVGEAVIHWNDFNEINSKLPEDQQYKTPRNLCSGSVRQLDSKICVERKVYFYAFNILECSEKLTDSKQNNFAWLWEQGFWTIFSLKTTENITQNDIDAMINYAKEINLPIDGLVVTFDSINYSESLGRTNHHPLHSLAYKFADETEETNLLFVEWNTTRSGQINPTAVFNPVELDGTEVSRASLFNLSFIKDMQLNFEHRIKVSKRNMIIPYVEENLDKNKNNGLLPFPDKCPSCGEHTIIENTGTADFLFCKNPNCPAQLLDKFVHFVSRDGMNVEGLSEQTLEKFINKGFIKTFSDIYKLSQHKDQIISMEGFGIKSYNKLIDAIEKSKNVKMECFILSLGIPQIGIGSSRRLAKYFKNSMNAFLLAIQKPYTNQLYKVPDFGDVTVDAIVQYFADENNSKQIVELLNNYITIIQLNNSNQTSNILSGKTFVITGEVTQFKNRKELQEKIELLGGKTVGSVSKNTTYLINNDIHSNSSKNQAAKELGVAIITEEEFMKMIGSDSNR